MTINLILGIVNLFALFVWLPFTQAIPIEIVKIYNDQYKDALQIAVSIGRLDLISFILTVLGIGIGLFAFVEFGYIRQKSETIAKETAEKAVIGLQEKLSPEFRRDGKVIKVTHDLSTEKSELEKE